MRAIIAVFAIAGAVYGNVIKDQWLDLAWHNFLDKYAPPWTSASPPRPPPPPPPKPIVHPKQASLNIPRKPSLKSSPGDEIKDQWLGLAWHNFLDKQTPPWTAAPPSPPPPPPSPPPPPPKPAMPPKQGSPLNGGIANGGWIPWYGYGAAEEFPWLQHGMQQPKRKPVVPKPPPPPPPPPRPELAPASWNIRQNPSLESSHGDVIKDQSLGIAWHNFLDRYTPPWTSAPPPPSPPPKPIVPPKQGSSLNEGIANGGWIPWYGYGAAVEFPWLQQGMQQPKRKPVMPKPPPPPRPEVARGDVIKDQSLGLAWHNFLDRYTPSWTPAPPPPPPPKPAMPPKQDDMVNGLWMPSWKFYNEIDPVTFPWFVKGYRTTAPGPMAPDGYSFFNYIL